MPFVAGRTAKARWNGQVVSFQAYRVRDADTGADMTNSEGAGYSEDIASCDNVEITLEFPSLNTDENLFIAPRTIRTNQTGHLTLYCAGVGGGVDWDLPVARVSDTDMSGRVGVGGAQPISATFRNKGVFKRPGES
jgi:hypothetical protein